MPRSPKDEWVSGLKVDPQIRKAVKIEAAKQEIQMEELVHRALCLAVDRPDLLAHEDAMELAESATN